MFRLPSILRQCDFIRIFQISSTGTVGYTGCLYARRFDEWAIYMAVASLYIGIRRRSLHQYHFPQSNNQ